jgi:hypothetical protein
MSILKRPPGDDFTFRLFFKLTNQIKKPKDIFYFWSICIDPAYNQISHFIGTQQFYENEITYRNIIINTVKTDLIIIGVKDHLTSNDFNPWVNNVPAMVVWLQQMLEFYHDKQIILFTSVENLTAYITNANVTIIPWGGDITNHQKEYLKLDPVLDKNFDSNYNYLSLNRNKRSHRAMLISLLYGLNLEQHGLISCMFKDKIENLFDYTQWPVPDKSIFENGFNKFKSSELLLNDDPKIYTNNTNDNANNFKNKLTNYYQNVFVEVITETSYTEKCFNLTEKTLNSIYGSCFPILICSQGSVAFLRNMGMDMFDDIIDHSYDIIEDPATRMYTAITNNIKVLTDNTLIKQLWKDNEYRFIKNIDFAKTRLYNFYTQRTTDKFHELINL